MRDILSYNWIIERRLSLKEREVLFLTMEANGLLVQDIVRTNQVIETHPYIAHIKHDHDGIRVFSYSSLTESWSKGERLPYEKVLSELQERIRNGEC